MSSAGLANWIIQGLLPVAGGALRPGGNKGVASTVAAAAAGPVAGAILSKDKKPKAKKAQMLATADVADTVLSGGADTLGSE